MTNIYIKMKKEAERTYKSMKPIELLNHIVDKFNLEIGSKEDEFIYDYIINELYKR